MNKFLKGRIKIPKTQLNLDLTLLGGQSFRWEKHESPLKSSIWQGVAYSAYWELEQTGDYVAYKVMPLKINNGDICSNEYFDCLLRKYFRIHFNLEDNMNKWLASHVHFSKAAKRINAVRVLDQEPLENIISFICSQNNNIRRISTMIEWFCSKFGSNIGTFGDKKRFSFPTLETLIQSQNELESILREAKFGYRARFIAESVKQINENGGVKWLSQLRNLPYMEAREELVKLPGVGFKVADCICLMSLNHLEAVPVDTHIFKVAQTVYMPQLANKKCVTPKMYEEIANYFRKTYGEFAGWAQAILFCSNLRQFQMKDTSNIHCTRPKRKNKCLTS